ncbi:MAG TPA: hypothetical protein EYM65_06900 [Dehalococcoidia bacterium]|nr:hypothetical protein [Dehalococcoidia bacterium]
MVITKTIEQTVTIKANPHDVYEALMDSENTPNSPGLRLTSAGRSVARSLPTAAPFLVPPLS